MKKLAVWVLALASLASAETRYEIELTFDSDAKTIIGVARITFKNESAAALEEVPFRLDLNRTGHESGWMEVGQIGDAGKPDLDLSYLKDRTGKDLGEFPVAKLSSPLAPGAETTLEVHFHGGVGTDTTTFWADDNDRGTTGAFFPRLVPREGTEWAKDEWLPASFRVAITAPENYRFFTSGKAIKTEKQEEGQAKTTFESKGMRGFGIVADPGIVEVTGDAGGVELRVASIGPESEAPRVIAMAKEAIAALTADLGKYPHPSLSFLVTDRTQELEASHGICILPRARLDSDRDLAAAVAYAAARAWWGEEVGDPGAFPRWLTSGFALHSCEKFLSKKFPDARIGEDWVKVYTDAAHLGFDTTMAQPVRSLWGAGFAWDRVISLAKGYSVLRLFSHRFPQPPLEERMKRILAERRGGLATSEALVEQCPQADRAAAKDFFRTWAMTDYEINYGVGGVEKKEGKSLVRVVRKGNAISRLEVEGITPDGKRARATWDGEGESGTVELDLPSEGLHVRLDPDHWLPDIDLSDNEWFPRPKKGPDLGKVAFTIDRKPRRAVHDDVLRWREGFRLDCAPSAPLDLGVEIEVTDADGAVSRTLSIAKGAAAGKPVEGDFELAGPSGKNSVHARVFAASSEAELAWAAAKEKPLWEETQEEQPQADLGGAGVGTVDWGLFTQRGLKVPLTLPGSGKARVWLEVRAGAPGFAELFRGGKAFEVERGKEASLELEGTSLGSGMKVELELVIGTLSPGEERPKPDELIWSKRKVIGR